MTDVKRGNPVWDCLERKVGPIILTFFPSRVYKKELTECMEEEGGHGGIKDK